MKNFFLQRIFSRRTGTSHSSFPQIQPPAPAASPHFSRRGPEGNSGWRKKGNFLCFRYWPWIVKMQVSGVISVSPGSCTLSYTEKSYIINLTCLLLVISSTLLMFDYMSPSHHSNKDLLYILAPPLTLQSSTSELLGGCLPGYSPQLDTLTKLKLQLLGCVFSFSHTT